MAASGYSGLFDGVADVDGNGVSGHSLLHTEENTDGNLRPSFRGRVSRLLRKNRNAMRVLNELMDTTIGASAGSAAAASYSRVDPEKTTQSVTGYDGNSYTVPVIDDVGGARAIETRTMISRNSTADDVTELKKLFSDDSKPTYPTDASGNGGGGKVGW